MGDPSALQVSLDGVSIFLNNRPDNFRGGKIKQFSHIWEGLSSDPQFLEFVHGDYVEFIDAPPLCAMPRTLRLNQSDQAALDNTVMDF